MRYLPLWGWPDDLILLTNLALRHLTAVKGREFQGARVWRVRQGADGGQRGVPLHDGICGDESKERARASSVS